MKLPQLGRVKLKGRKLPKTMPKMVTVSKDTTGRYWTSFSVAKHVRPIPRPPRKSVGIDLGINCFAALSTGERVENPRHLAQDEKRLKKLQQRMARQTKGSKRRMRTTKRIARLHSHIACKRLDFLHKVTMDLVRRFRVICVESLNVKGMMTSAKGTVENPGTNVRQRAGSTAPSPTRGGGRSSSSCRTRRHGTDADWWRSTNGSHRASCARRAVRRTPSSPCRSEPGHARTATPSTTATATPRSTSKSKDSDKPTTARGTRSALTRTREQGKCTPLANRGSDRPSRVSVNRCTPQREASVGNTCDHDDGGMPKRSEPMTNAPSKH